jgi:hypothetical protein
MSKLFAPHLGYAKVYLDDILVYSDTLEEHLVHMKGVLETCANGVYLSQGKCEFAVTSELFLRHIISNGTISHPPSYIDPIVCQALPTNVSGLRSFIGQLN